jgi:hypothetical protein
VLLDECHAIAFTEMALDLIAVEENFFAGVGAQNAAKGMIEIDDCANPAAPNNGGHRPISCNTFLRAAADLTSTTFGFDQRALAA